MKAMIEMKVKRVKNAFTGKYVEVDENLSNDKNFRKAMAKNTEKICSELEKYYNEKGIQCEFTYYFDDNGKY
jgi:hypothetical protein